MNDFPVERLFWYRKSPPPRGSSEWLKTVLEEGGEDDLQQVKPESLQELNVAILGRKVQGLWTCFLQREAEKKMNSDKVITGKHREILRLASNTLAPCEFMLAGGTGLSVEYLVHRRSEDLDLFTTREDGVSAAKNRFVSACRDAGLTAREESKRSSGTFSRLWVGDPGIKVELAYQGAFLLETPTRTVEGMPVMSLPDLAADKVLALWSRWATRDFVDVYFLAKEHFELSEMEKLAGQKDDGFKSADRYLWAQALAKVESMDHNAVELLRPMEWDDCHQFFQQAAERTLRNIRDRDLGG